MNAPTAGISPGSAALWSALAKQWSLIDVPLRPCAEDLRCYRAVIQGWQTEHPGRAVRGLLLGVTAEIAGMRWPEDATLTAVDHSLPMVAGVWPRPAFGLAVCADWRAMPLPRASCDVALGDGCLTLLPPPAGYAAFASSLRAVLTDDGLVALRCFCRPARAERPEAVLADLDAPRVRGFHAFKWRLVMSLHGSLEEGVRLAEVWDLWASSVRDPDAIADRCGWPRELVRSLELYRENASRYFFPTVEEAAAALAPQFSLRFLHAGGYELAERCPILVYRAR
jgi:SAM-dependent methyltransferase